MIQEVHEKTTRLYPSAIKNLILSDDKAVLPSYKNYTKWFYSKSTVQLIL